MRTGTVRNGNGDQRERSVMARERERKRSGTEQERNETGTEWKGNGERHGKDRIKVENFI